MDQRLADLQQQFDLERLEVNLFRGESRDTGSPQVFGGQVLGQALKAAHATIEGPRRAFAARVFPAARRLHASPSSTAWIAAATAAASRRGASSPSRTASRSSSARRRSRSPERASNTRSSAPKVPPPEELQAADQAARRRRSTSCRRSCGAGSRSSGRSNSARCSRYNPLAPVACEPVRQIWMRAVDKLPDDDTLHRCLLAYISDYWLLDTATMPHGSSFLRGNLVMASIDHAIWFHRPARVDDWLLYSLDSPSSSGARGFARGSFYSRARRAGGEHRARGAHTSRAVAILIGALALGAGISGAAAPAGGRRSRCVGAAVDRHLRHDRRAGGERRAGFAARAGDGRAYRSTSGAYRCPGSAHTCCTSRSIRTTSRSSCAGACCSRSSPSAPRRVAARAAIHAQDRSGQSRRADARRHRVGGGLRHLSSSAKARSFAAARRVENVSTRTGPSSAGSTIAW